MSCHTDKLATGPFAAGLADGFHERPADPDLATDAAYRIGRVAGRIDHHFTLHRPEAGTLRTEAPHVHRHDLDDQPW